MKIRKPNYKDSIMNVTNSFLHYYGVKTDYNGQADLDKILQERKPNHIIYILLDGMGLNVINKHLKDTDYLKKYALKGISSVFPPTTVAATNAVLSGRPPLTTGYLGWVQYFKEYDVNLVVFQNRDFYEDSVTIDENLAAKYLSYESFLDKIKRADQDIKTYRFFPSFIPGGSESFAEQTEKVLIMNQNTDKSISYVYWVEPDLTEHKFGIYSDEVKSVLEGLNTSFTELCDNVSEDTLIVCIADHGLTDIEEIPLYEYKELTDMLIRNPSIEPRAINFFVKEGKKKDFKKLFNKHFEDKFTLYTKQEFLETKLLGEGKEHPMVREFLGDYIGVAIDKYMFSLHQGKHYKAHHAGLLEDEMIVPLIIK